MMMFKEIIDLLQSSRKIVFILTFSALLIILQDIYFQFFILDKNIKAISFIALIMGGLFFIWDLIYVLGSWFANLKSLKLTAGEFFILNRIWDSPDETIYLNREKISPEDFSKLKIILSDLIEKDFIGAGYNDSYYLKSKGSEAIKQKLRE